MMVMAAVVMMVGPNVTVAPVRTRAADHADVAAVPGISALGETGEQHGCADENGERFHIGESIKSQFRN